MTRKIYRTAQGKTVDLGSLQLQNENVRAVGNMKVNARGDIIDSMNRPIATRNQQVARQYRRQTTNVTDASTIKKNTPSTDEIPTPPEDFQDDFDKTLIQSSAQPSGAATGLAAAIAKARQIKQVPITPTNDATGIKKI